MKRSTWILAALGIGLTIPVLSFAKEPATNATTPPPASSKSTYGEHSSKQAKHMVNINTASKEELMALPGLDEATAGKIIEARPFKSSNQLLEKKLLSKQEYNKIHSMVTVGHPPKEAAKK